MYLWHLRLAWGAIFSGLIATFFATVLIHGDEDIVKRWQKTIGTTVWWGGWIQIMLAILSLVAKLAR